MILVGCCGSWCISEVRSRSVQCRLFTFLVEMRIFHSVAAAARNPFGRDVTWRACLPAGMPAMGVVGACYLLINSMQVYGLNKHCPLFMIRPGRAVDNFFQWH